MVRTGVTRAFGPALRRALARSTRNRLNAFATGLGVTTVLQSSTATAVLISSLAGRGLLTLPAALAILLGADVGTTIVAQILTFDLSWLSPLLLITGVVSFTASSGGAGRHLGRVAIGLGLMLLALSLIVGSAAGIGTGDGLRALIGPLADEPLLLMLLAALLTWLAHSSLAMVLVLISLMAAGALEGAAAFALLLGINVGGAIPAFTMTLASGPLARRVTAGNLVMRTLGALVCLIAWPWAEWLVSNAAPSPERAIANLHTLFNVLLAAAFLPLVDRVGRLCEKLLPAPAATDASDRPRHLDSNALDEPGEALACAARETLRVGDTVQDMLARAIIVFRTDDERLAREIGNLDDRVDKLHEAVKFYLMQVSREALDPDESRRYIEVLSMNTNLEHIGDIVDRNLMELAIKKIRARAVFSDEGMSDITAFHARVVDNLKLSLNVFMSGDRAMARRLLQEKSAAREAERHAAEKHMARLRAGRPETIDSSSIHLDVIRDLKRINSHITSVAYAILEDTTHSEPGRWDDNGQRAERSESAQSNDEAGAIAETEEHKRDND